MANLSMFIVMLAALLIPIMMARFKVNTVPTAVAEILMGIILGKSALNIVVNTTTLKLLSNIGVIILMFLSGMEIDFSLFKRDSKNQRPAKEQAKNQPSPLMTAGLAFGSVVVTACLLAWVLKALHIFEGAMLATIILSTVALGVVIATLKEKEILAKPAGQSFLLTAVLGEVTPMLALSCYASIYGGNAGRLWMLILLFVAAIILLYRFRQPYEWFAKITKSTTQVDIRLAFFLIFALVTVAETVGAEAILGGFLAGMVMKLLEPSEATRDKLTSIGYGFFIPIFFIMTGVKLNLKALFANPDALAMIPALVLAFIIAKLPTWLIYRRTMTNRNALAGSFLEMTTITLVLPALQVARSLHSISNTQSSAFILAAVIVCLCGPVLFNSIYKLEKQDLVKQRVVLMGANVVSVPVAQQLVKEYYDVRMMTARKSSYATYNSRAPHLTYHSDLSEESLAKAGFFDCDILVVALGELKTDQNLEIAAMAKKHGVKRAIAQIRMSKPNARHRELVQNNDLEVLNAYNVETSVLKNLIESPLLMNMLVNSDAGLFEATLRNQKYAGSELQSLAFIDDVTINRIYRNHKWIVPTGRTILELGDRILFTGSYKQIAEFMDDVQMPN